MSGDSRRRRSKLALACGVALAVVAHVTLSLAGASFLIRDPLYADLEARLSRAERLHPASPVVLFLGTSRVGAGFDARWATAECAHPVTAFNFGVPGSGPITHATYLRRLLAAGHRPDLLLLEVLPTSVADRKEGPPEAPMLSGARFLPDEIDALAAYDVPRERLRTAYRETVTTPWLGLRFPLLGRVAPSALPSHRRHDEGRNGDDLGWHRIMEEALTPEMLAHGAARARRDYAPALAALRPGGPAERALRDTVALARDHGIPVRLVLMPEARWFRDLYPPPVAAHFDRWVRDLARATGSSLTDAREWVPDSGFADGHHLLPGGAAAFTRRLCDEVIVPHLASATGRTP